MNGQTLNDFIIECLERAVEQPKPKVTPLFDDAATSQDVGSERRTVGNQPAADACGTVDRRVRWFRPTTRKAPPAYGRHRGALRGSSSSGGPAEPHHGVPSSRIPQPPRHSRRVLFAWRGRQITDYRAAVTVNTARA